MMRIKEIKINRLFNTFDYNLTMPTGEEPLIITGSNGYGKTTLLNIISHLASRDLYYFYLLPFAEIKVTFDDDISLFIKSVEEEHDDDGDHPARGAVTVTFTLVKGNASQCVLTLSEKEIVEKVSRMAMYRGQPFGSIPSVHDKAFHELLRRDNALYSSLLKRDGEGRELDILLSGLNVTFIEEQRRWAVQVAKDPNGVIRNMHVPAVTKISQSLAKILQKANNSYLEKAHDIDENLITRIVDGEEAFGELEYNERKAAAENRLTEFTRYGLVGEMKMLPYSPESASILTVVLKSVEEKIHLHDKVMSKIRLFSDLLTTLALVNKEISYNPRDGLIVRTKEGVPISLEALSSGEQHELIMLYNIIFDVKDNSLLLIDEPEMSLHVVWQNHFIDDIVKIASIKGLQVVIATHSPQIISSRWEECYDLCEAQRR